MSCHRIQDIQTKQDAARFSICRPIITTEYYDDDTGTWQPGHNLPEARANHGVVAASDVEILIMGGEDAVWAAKDAVILFNVATGKLCFMMQH